MPESIPIPERIQAKVREIREEQERFRDEINRFFRKVAMFLAYAGATAILFAILGGLKCGFYSFMAASTVFHSAMYVVFKRRLK